MSAYWAFRPLAVPILVLLALASGGAGPAQARPTEVSVAASDGRVTRRVSVNGAKVSVTTSRSDSDSSVVTLRGEVDAGPVVVRSDGSGIVRLFSDAEIARDERVEGDVVAVFGSVRVDGEVMGSVVAVFGSVDLRNEAVVRGDAVAVGGGLHEDPGARVSGDTVQVGFLPLTLGLPGLPLVLTCIVLAWLISLFFGWAAAALFPQRLTRVAIISSQRTAASLAIGVVSGPLLLMTMLLLLVTVVGIPIAFFLPLAYVAVAYLGQLAATYVLGCKLTRQRLGDGGIMRPLLAGSLLVASVFGFGAILWETPGMVRTVALFFLMVGVLLVLGLSAIGTGAFILSRAGSRPRAAGASTPDLGPSSGPAAGAPAASA